MQKPSSRDGGFFSGLALSRAQRMTEGYMKKTIAALIAIAAMVSVLALAGCGGSNAAPAGTSAEASEAPAAAAPAEGALAPGNYTADFKTDSSMFHVNETQDGKGILTVDNNGQMTIHVSLVSKRIENLYMGTVDQAEADEANWLQPTLDEMTYDDGYTDEVYGFDIPVPTLDEPFDVAILGEKGKWYDHKVTVSNPEPLEL